MGYHAEPDPLGLDFQMSFIAMITAVMHKYERRSWVNLARTRELELKVVLCASPLYTAYDLLGGVLHILHLLKSSLILAAPVSFLPYSENGFHMISEIPRACPTWRALPLAPSVWATLGL